MKSRIYFEHLPPVTEPTVEEVLFDGVGYRATIDHYRTYSAVVVTRKEDGKIVARAVFWSFEKPANEPPSRQHEEYIYSVENPRQAAHAWITQYIKEHTS